MRRVLPTPRYEHDCLDCTYIGQFASTDCYVCNNESKSVVIRYSSVPDEYDALPMHSAMLSTQKSYKWAVASYRDLVRAENRARREHDMGI